MNARLERRVVRLEQAQPTDRIVLFVETRAGEAVGEAVARCRQEQGIPEGVRPGVTGMFLGLRGG